MNSIVRGVAVVFLLVVGSLNAALDSRQPNSTINMPQNPATFGYTLTNAFPGIPFHRPIAIATPPGETNRLFVMERFDGIIVMTNLASPNRTMFLNLGNRMSLGCEDGLLGMAFHPNFASNGYFYVFWSVVTNTAAGSGVHQRVSRFQVTSTNANLALPQSELPLITQYDRACDHNAGDIHFGPDGYLYISVGDEGQQNDFYDNSQRIDKNFFGGMLRIDVDKRSTNLPPNPHPALMNATNYFVPADNPFIGLTQFNGTNINTAALRTEFWAVGLRNPFRFSFDPVTGDLYCGDVGGSLREEINLLRKGGNYGWVWREGTFAGPSGSKQGPANFSSIAPIAQYAHGSATNQGNAIMGGIVSRGSRLSQLNGQYVFADWQSGHVWSLTPNGTNTVPFQYLTTHPGIACFAADPRNGDVLLGNINYDILHRLVYDSNVVAGSMLPATLADTGVFQNLNTMAPNPGVVPYDVNVPFWSDNAKKFRWFSIPDTNLTMNFSAGGNWQFPTGTVWVKHFEIETNASFFKRLETRLLVKNANGVYGVTYRWGNSASNATLVPEEGMDEQLVINDGGILRTQVWHYPSRAECLTCHTPHGGFALGFNTEQLNRDFIDAPENQIAAFQRTGYFSTPVTNISTLKQLAHATNTAWSLEWRVRSYLAANCAQCHQPGGSALGNWDARITNPLSLSGIINGALISNLGDTNNRVIVPNDPAHSVLLTRITTNTPLRMPPLASNLPDTSAIQLLSAWITNDLSGYLTFAEWQLAKFGSTNAPNTGPSEDFDNDRSSNFQEYLLGTHPANSADAWRLSIGSEGDSVSVQFPQVQNRGFEVQFSTNLSTASVWQVLASTQNRPFFSSSNNIAVIHDPITNTSRFYRVRTYEP